MYKTCFSSSRAISLLFLPLAAAFVCANGNGAKCMGDDGFPRDENDPALPAECFTTKTVPTGQDCLCMASGIASRKRRNITYDKNATHAYNGPVLDQVSKWSSGQVVSGLVRILLEEGIGYNYASVGTTWRTGQFVLGPSGCKHIEKFLEPCDDYDEYNPQFHLGLEGWSQAQSVVDNNLVPIERRALELSKHTYSGREALYIAKSALDKAYYSEKMILGSYKGWNGTMFPEIGAVLDTLGDALTKLGGKFAAKPLSMQKDDYVTRAEAKYVDSIGGSSGSCYNATTGVLTSDSMSSCEGNVWVAPACRSDPLAQCIPAWTTSGWAFAEMVQWAAFHDMPLAVIDTTWGEYTSAPNIVQSAFFWWFPDQTFSANRPEYVAFPPHSPDEHASAVFKTDMKLTVLSKFCWHHLGKADKGRGENIIYMLDRLAIYESEINNLMVQLGSGLPAQDVACGFARQYEARWREWIPLNINWCEADEMLGDAEECIACKEGHVPAADGSSCIPCTAGYYCRIGVKPILCDPGFFCPSASFVQKACPEGTFNSQAGANSSTSCVACAPGTYMGKEGRSFCKQCPVGFYSEQPGSISCTACGVSTYQNTEGKSKCESCSASFTTMGLGTTSLSECTCAKGRYWDRAADKCVSCQPESFCPGGLSPPFVYEGYHARLEPPESGNAALLAAEEDAKRNGTHSPSSQSFWKMYIWKCAGPLTCPRAKEKQIGELTGSVTDVSVIGVRRPGDCPPSRGDIACAVCDADHFGPLCAPCEGQPALAVIVLSVLILPLAMLLIGQWYRDCEYEAKADVYYLIGAMVGLILYYGQCVGIMSNMAMDWHPTVAPTMETSGHIFLIDLRDAVTMCVTGSSYFVKYWEAFCVPLLIIVATLVAQGMSRVLPPVRGHEWAIRWECTCNVLGSVLTGLYVYMVQNTTAFFECVPNPAAEATLAKYKHIECGSERHAQATPAMVLSVLFYVVGFFALCLVLATVAPRHFKSRSFRECVYFLVYRWKPGMWYFNVLNMLRNVLVASGNSVSKDGATQLFWMGSVLLIFATMMCLTRPWKATTLSYVDALSSVMLVILLFFGYSVLFCGEKIKNLRWSGLSHLALEWEGFVATFTWSMIVSNIVLGVGGAVLLAQMVNELRPSVQTTKRAHDKFALTDLCTLIEDMSSHPRFGAALQRTIEVGNDEDTAAMKGFITSVVHRLKDENLSTRMEDSMGKQNRLERDSGVGSAASPGFMKRARTAMGSTKSKSSLMSQHARDLFSKQEEERATVDEATNMPNNNLASVVPMP